MEIFAARKITVKGVCGAIPRFNEDERKIVRDLMTVIGVVNGLREKEDTLHPGQLQWALVGNFEAVELSTGNITTATEAFLPGVIQDALVSAMKSAPDQNIKFAVKLAVKHSDKPIGYEYVAKQMFKPQGVDLLSELRDSIKNVPTLTLDNVTDIDVEVKSKKKG